jgi:hypothetical protein
MDIGRVDQSGWATYLPLFGSLLAPSGASDSPSRLETLGFDDDTIARARADNASLGALGDRLVNLVFDGYRNWYQIDDAWVLSRLAEVLDDAGEQQSGLLSELRAIVSAGDEDARKMAIETFVSLAEQYAASWQSQAEQDGYTRVQAVDEAVLLQGSPNTDNWEADRIPGTYYYVFVDGRYLYSDLAEASIVEWETLPERQRLAAELAEAWGNAFCTPTGGDPAYGGHYVFALDPAGPWMTQQAFEEAAATGPTTTGPTTTGPPTTGPGPENVVVEGIAAARAAKLEELFAELTAAGWNPDDAADDESVPTREQVIEFFDRQVKELIVS